MKQTTIFSNTIPSRLANTIILSAGLFLVGCGSSDTSDNSTTTDDTALTGQLELAITDAEEDFLSYRIDLESIQLKKTNGTLVEVLPLESEIDFVQYQELSELFAVLSVPAGTYQSVLLGLDYSDSDIVIQDEEGNSYQASVQDEDGNSIGQIQVELNLNEADTFEISPFRTAQLTLDLDLEASNTIESFDPPLVTVEPFMVGSTSLDLDREHRVRGLLETVNVDESNVTLKLIPMRLRRGEFGDYDITVDDSTSYEIDGVEYSAEEGLSVLAEQAEDTAVVAYGGPSEEDGVRYLATQVLAGSSVPWSEQDILKGTITSRSDNSLSIKGAVVELQDENNGKAGHFQTDITLQISDETVVTGYRLGDADIANLSVGQKILALGQFDSESDVFSATEGHVRMKLNKVVGEVVTTSPLELDVSHINKRPVDLFDFSGTGVDSANDADPDQYEIDSSTLDLSAIQADEWLQVRGYPSAFGASPTDFDALSIVNPDFVSHAARMSAKWETPSATAISVESGTLNLDLEDARSKLHLKGIPGSSKLEFTVEQIVSTAEEGRFSIATRSDGIHMYSDFDSFVNAVNAYLQDGLSIQRLTASGQYSDIDKTIDANYATLRMTESQD